MNSFVEIFSDPLSWKYDIIMQSWVKRNKSNGSNDKSNILIKMSAEDAD